MRGRLNFFGIVVPRRNAIDMQLSIAIPFIFTDNCPSATDLRRQVVELIEDLCLENALLEALLFAEGILVLCR